MGDVIEFPGEHIEQTKMAGNGFASTMVASAYAMDLGHLKALASKRTSQHPNDSMGGLLTAILKDREARGETERKRDLRSIMQGMAG